MGGLRRPIRDRRADRGASAVEFALILVPMLYLVFGVISYAYMFSFRQALSQSASEGSRAAVGAYNTTDGICPKAGPFTSSGCPAQYAASIAVKNALNTYGKTCGAQNLTCTISIGAATTMPAVNSTPISACATGHVCISVAITYPYRAHSLLPTVPGIGFVLPKSLGFTSVVQLS